MIELFKPILAAMLVVLVGIALYNEYVKLSQQAEKEKLRIEISVTKDKLHMAKTIRDEDTVDILLSFAVKIAKVLNVNKDVVKATIDEFYEREDL
ncbi:MAG: hypothetical protein PHE21_03990 [Candidatus Dojkabacteria bacterium]|nr:hypothetical protein [Candidatus Dojkabacteria bacterium]